MQEIGQRLGLTRERVRQIEAPALTRLRAPPCATGSPPTTPPPPPGTPHPTCPHLRYSGRGPAPPGDAWTTRRRERDRRTRGGKDDTAAPARVWTLCLAALVRAALTGPVADLLTPLAQASALALTLLAAILAVALVSAFVALAVLLAVAVLCVVRPRSIAHR